MSTVKISQLPDIPGGLNANTSNSLFLGVDIPTGVTGKFTATQLAARLYANNVLNVGDNSVILPNVVAQFTGTSSLYIQSNLQNDGAEGSADHVITGDIGTDTENYLDLGLNNSNYNGGASSLYKPLDGYLYVQGAASSSDPGGNLAIGTTTQNKDILFFQGGTDISNIVGRFVYNSGLKLVSKPLTFADGTSQNTSASPVAYSEASFEKANTASGNTIALQAVNVNQNTRIDIIEGVNTGQNTRIDAVNTYAFGAYAKANAALANTSGTFAGNLTVTGNIVVLGTTSSTGPISTGNLTVSGTSTLTGNVTMSANTYMTGAVTVNSTMVLANTNFSPTEAALTITASGTTATPSNDGYLIHLSGKNGVPSRLVSDSYGANSYVVFAGRAARGTISSPSALQANDVIARFSSNGYGTTKYQTLGVGRIDFVAAENFTDANTGSQIKFWNCAVGSNTLTNILTLNGDSAEFSGVVKPDKGFVYTPNVQGTLTTFGIDFKRDSLIKFNVTADASITLSNYVYGKVVEVWITNSAAQNKTITHGCFANNSTSKQTTFTIAAQSCAYLKYFSIDGDLANTFVSITA